MDIYVSWRAVRGGWGASLAPPGPASVFARSIRGFIRKIPSLSRILALGTSQTDSAYIFAHTHTCIHPLTHSHAHTPAPHKQCISGPTCRLVHACLIWCSQGHAHMLCTCPCRRTPTFSSSTRFATALAACRARFSRISCLRAKGPVDRSWSREHSHTLTGTACSSLARLAPRKG